MAVQHDDNTLGEPSASSPDHSMFTAAEFEKIRLMQRTNMEVRRAPTGGSDPNTEQSCS